MNKKDQRKNQTISENFSDIKKNFESTRILFSEYSGNYELNKKATKKKEKNIEKLV